MRINRHPHLPDISTCMWKRNHLIERSGWLELLISIHLNPQLLKLSQSTPHWEKYQLGDYLNKYDRIIYLDTDIIIRPDCPNLFDIVSDNKLGIVDEGHFTERLPAMKSICQSTGEEINRWKEQYYNTGVMVISRRHKELFTKPILEYENFYEQSYINLRIINDKWDVHELGYKFNHMSAMDMKLGTQRHSSYIVHYAGQADQIPNFHQVIRDDIKKWEDDSGSYKYPRGVLVNMSGGIGDQIDAEPVVRYMKETYYKDDEIVVVSHWPRLFRHFEKLGIKVYGDKEFKPTRPFYQMITLPHTSADIWQVWMPIYSHTTDYAQIIESRCN